MEERYEFVCEIMGEMDKAYDFMYEYDSIPHSYGNDVLYQAESHLIQHIGQREGVTITELSKILNKTRSACSQIVRKLCKKGWVEQVRNVKNNREYKLYLTEKGMEIYKNHEEFDKSCYRNYFTGLEQFSEKELKTYLKVQKKINDLFKCDIERTYRYFDNMENKEK